MKMKIQLNLLLCLLGASTAVAAEPEPLNFSRDIRPILSAKCFACHGPDAQERAADFRIDTMEGALSDLGGYAGIVPGEPDESEVVLRITNDDPDMLMPPVDHKNPLTSEEIQLLSRWIAEGAPYAGHWAFEPVRRPEPPVTDESFDSPIDRLIVDTLHRKGLELSPPATAETLIRRLFLDLTGLPPTLDQVDEFVEDPDGQYEATIDRLMNSPAFNERLASDWLDVARFADTNGYSIDDHRDMWAWRDWVIHAFQTNMPYDEFIREQLAGDLLDNPTESQKIATGFLRNSMNTHEGGTIAEEYRVASILDKVDTVSTAFLGLTVKCAQCHDHKYDPISQRDFYRFFAFFNSSSETGTGGTNGNTNPVISVDPILNDAETLRESLRSRIASLQHTKAYPEELLGNARKDWEQTLLADADLKTAQRETLISTTTFESLGNLTQAEELSWVWANPQGAGEFAWFRKSFDLAEVPQAAQMVVSCDNEAVVYINGIKLGDAPDWRTPTVMDPQPLLVKGRNVIAVAGKDWEKGGSMAALAAFVSFSNGDSISTDTTWLASNQDVQDWNRIGDVDEFTPASVVAKYGAAPWGTVFDRLDQPSQNAKLISAIRKPDVQRSLDEQNLVATEFAKINSDMNNLLRSIDGEINELKESIDTGKTTTMVMDDAKADRKTPILLRGQYDQHGEMVEAGIPEVFGSLPSSDRADRLALAEWLIDPKHPLTARVTVNRYWQLLFGTGLVKTTEDFGSQGEWPSHPELLDYLASEFIASGWDVRALLKSILLSKTYQQSSVVNAELLEQDPYNRLYARAPRYRLSAEAVRDSSLSIAGLLNLDVGGPSVYPPQPLGLWKEVSHFGYPGFFSAQHYFADRDERVYRRSLYTFWKRTSPPPVMTTFDAPNRETCTVRRSLTNTPLQALVLMNAPQFIEASRGLAMRMLDSGRSSGDQIRYGFRLATAREPSIDEFAVLEAAWQHQFAYFTTSPQRAEAYLRGSDWKQYGDSAEVAAITSVASLILNLDETITRE